LYRFTQAFVGPTATDSNAVQTTPSIGTSDLITLPAGMLHLFLI